MAEFVEGDWKGYTFKMAQPEDYPRILEHLRESFYRDEPINMHLGQSEAKNADMDRLALAYLPQNLSFFVLHRESGKIAGVRVTGISRKDDKPEELFSIFTSPEIQDLAPPIMQLSEEANVFEKFNIDSIGDFLFVCVGREFRGQGLATEMYHRAIKLLKSKGLPAAKSFFTNAHSQRIARNLGFTELARMKFKDFKKRDGTPLLPNAGDEDHEVSIVMAKMI